MQTQEQLEQKFASLGIDYSRPGFYDHPNFLAAEQRDSRFLETYAEYVEVRTYPEEYLRKARATVERMSSFLFAELERDGRLGACVDISGAFARMLDQEEIWAYPVAGGVSVHFPEPTGSRYFGAISRPGLKIEAGHMWVRVPPFQAVDISFALQPWADATRSLPLHAAIIEEFREHVPTIYELVDMEFLGDLVREEGEMPTVSDVFFHKPYLLPFMRRFRAFEGSVGGLPVAYVPTAVKMSQNSIETLQQPILNDQTPVEIYARYCDSRSEGSGSKS